MPFISPSSLEPQVLIGAHLDQSVVNHLVAFITIIVYYLDYQPFCHQRKYFQTARHMGKEVVITDIDPKKTEKEAGTF